jgi:hypothetical protein
MIPYGKQTINQDDIDSVLKVLNENEMLTTGKYVPEFENMVCEYIGCKYALAVNSGTAALHLATFALDIKDEDEVIVPALSFVASSNCVLYQRGKPVFCDINPDKHFYCIDTFEGIPEVDKVDIHRKGDFSISLDTVKQTLTSFLGRITFIKGRFPTDNPNLLDNKTFSLVHIDVDIYTSMLECLQYFWPKMNKGGIIIMDDFFAPTTPGATKAIMEFFNWSQIKQAALYQCYVVKE